MTSLETIESGAKFIYYDGDRFAELVDKYPAFAKKLRVFLEEKLYSFREHPFKYPTKDVFIQEIKENIVFHNPNVKEKIKAIEKAIEKEVEIKQEEKKNFNFVWEKDLKNYEQSKISWLVDKLIPEKSVGVWTGKRGTFKTFLTLNMAVCVSEGDDFLNKYPTKKKKILYLDKENGMNIMLTRTNMIKKGLGKQNKDLDIGYICWSQLKLDKNTDVWDIEEVIKTNDIGLLIVDTYRRAISFDENDAGNVSKLFVDILRPLVEKYDLSIILIHHDRKGKADGDEMDMIRGSSDLANYCDFILKNDRKGKLLILKQLKCRSAMEIEPIKVSHETDETSYFRFKSDGIHEKQTEEDRCTETLMIWIESNNIESFKTSEAQDVAFSKGISKNNFHNGLNNLTNQGVIEQMSKGKWEVVSNQKCLE